MLLFICFTALNACKKEETYLYGINDVEVKQEGAIKPSVKSTTEFISIAYADIYGTTISGNDLIELSVLYSAFGDKKLMENMIIKNFLNAPGIAIPTKVQMNADLDNFLKTTYSKFLNREPNEFELYGTRSLVQADTSITPELIYYGMLTCNEYRHY
jgi:hypothetical protein